MLSGAPLSALASPARPMPKMGPYTPFRRLAAGGMGEIFLAHIRGPSGFEKLVVVKRILPTLANDEGFVSMFLNEARIAATLSHPNIVQIFDAGRADDSYYFTMEYLQGADLGQILRAAAAAGSAVPLEHVLTIIMAAAAGLHHAHDARGPNGAPLEIVHRDVSPSNVMVTFEGGIKLLDFGIAKALAATSVTREGTRKGKVAYMSPEQCLGRPLDRRSDIFALGILLYEASVMRRLFRGSNEFAIMNVITSGQVPPPSAVRADYPPELERIVLKALARDREDRYATARDMLQDLEHFARGCGIYTSPAATGRYLHELFGEQPYPTPDADETPTIAYRRFADLPAVTAIDDVLPTRLAATLAETRSAGGPSRSLRRWLGPSLGFTAAGFALALALDGARGEPSLLPERSSSAGTERPAAADPESSSSATSSARTEGPAASIVVESPASVEPAPVAIEFAASGATVPTPDSPAPTPAAGEPDGGAVRDTPASKPRARPRRTFEEVMQRASSAIRACLRKRGLLDGDSVWFDVHITAKTGRIGGASPRGPHKQRTALGECVINETARTQVWPPPDHPMDLIYEIPL